MAKKVNKVGVPAPMSDKDWQAEDDARTLMNAKVIEADRRRVNAACKAAKRMASEKEKEARAIASVAKRKKRG